jgi:UDP-N-acetylmuramoyl-L-alanyl-D-glutamate--2,6-diaminopimelate ligase
MIHVLVVVVKNTKNVMVNRFFRKLKRKIIALFVTLHFYGNPSKKLKIIAVTGTNGKTTVTTLLYKIATALGYKAGLIGTVENIIAGEVIPATHTTPSPLELNKLLKKMVSAGCEYVFMEVSSHALDQNRVGGLSFTGAVFTNLTQDHLDYHKSFSNYFFAKKRLFNMLDGYAFALTNIGDKHGLEMVSNISAVSYTYGFIDEAVFTGKIRKMDFEGIRLLFNSEEFKAPLLGKFNAENLTAVLATCDLLNFDMKKIKEIILTIEPPRGRFDYFVSKKGVLVVIDYAHTPDALEKIINTANELKNPENKLITVFGCGGDRDTVKRMVMGQIGASLSDVAIFTSDNPRSEDPMSIIDMMKDGLSAQELLKVKIIPDRREAIASSMQLAEKGDIVLCAGKGHETYQEIKGAKIHFNDMEEYKKLDQE